MKLVRASAYLRNPGAIASLVAVSTLAVFAVAPKASAVSLVPRQECEINVGLPLLDGSRECDSDSLFFSVRSQTDRTTNARSRLFIDNPATANTYDGISFATRDFGTNPPQGQYWLRPVAVNPDGTFPENGQLEVGTFTFTFSRVVDLALSLFDVETSNTTQVLAINNQPINFSVPAGANNSLYRTTFDNVRSITLKLGAQNAGFVTGDGVSIQELASLRSVPEPGITFGLGAIAVTGLLGWRKRSQKAV